MGDTGRGQQSAGPQWKRHAGPAPPRSQGRRWWNGCLLNRGDWIRTSDRSALPAGCAGPPDNRTMRIALHVPRGSHLKAGFSGDRVYLRDLQAGLRRRGHHVEVMSRLNVRDVWRGRVGVRELGREARRVQARARKLDPDAWLVYDISTTNPDLFGWWLAGRRYVAMNADAGRGSRIPRRWRRLMRAAHARSLARADALAAYHSQAAANLREAGVDPERIELLIPAAQPPERIVDRAEARRVLGIPSENPLVLCITRFATSARRVEATKTRMVLDLIEATSHLPDHVRVAIAGDGPGREAIVAAAELEPRVELVGEVDDAAKPLWLSAADVFAYPHRVNRPWLAILEAQSFGLPVVALRTPATEMTVADGRTGVLADDLEGFADALAALIGDRGRCEVMGESARAYIADVHSIERRVDRIEELLR